jgi:hypothetical protein
MSRQADGKAEYEARKERAENVLGSNPEYGRLSPIEAIAEALADLLALAAGQGHLPPEVARLALERYEEATRDRAFWERIAVADIAVGDVLDLDNEGTRSGKPRRVLDFADTGKRSYVEFDDGEPGTPFGHNDRLWRRTGARA